MYLLSSHFVVKCKFQGDRNTILFNAIPPKLGLVPGP